MNSFLIFKRYKYNALLGLAILCFCQTILLSLYSDDNFYLRLTYHSEFVLPYFLLLVMLFLGPVYEEIVFRGIFTQSKYSKIFKYIFLVGTIILLPNTEGNLKFILSISFVLLFGSIFFFLKKKKKEMALILLSIVVFCLIHYNIENFSYLNFIRTIGSRLGAALLFTWVCMNFGLLYSILVHFLFNLIVLTYFFTNNSPHVIEGDLLNNQKIHYSISEHNFFFNKANLKRSANKYDVEKGKIHSILKYLNVDSITKEIIYVKNSFHSYDLQIIDKHDDLTVNEILQVLEQAELIKIGD